MLPRVPSAVLALRCSLQVVARVAAREAEGGAHPQEVSNPDTVTRARSAARRAARAPTTLCTLGTGCPSKTGGCTRAICLRHNPIRNPRSTASAGMWDQASQRSRERRARRGVCGRGWRQEALTEDDWYFQSPHEHRPSQELSAEPPVGGPPQAPLSSIVPVLRDGNVSSAVVERSARVKRGVGLALVIAVFVGIEALNLAMGRGRGLAFAAIWPALDSSCLYGEERVEEESSQEEERHHDNCKFAQNIRALRASRLPHGLRPCGKVVKFR